MAFQPEVIRNQYFFLGEEILSALPMAAIKLVAGLLLIEIAEPGKEGALRLLEIIIRPLEACASACWARSTT